MCELVKRAVGDIIQRDFSMEQIGLVSVSEVTVSPDLRNATVFISVVGSEDQRRRAPRVIRQNLRSIQMALGKAITLKRTPHLKIASDDSAERGVRVIDIIEELEREDSLAFSTLTA